MIVAVVAMHVMEMPAHQEIHVVPVRNGFLAPVVAGAWDGVTDCRVCFGDGNHMLLIGAAFFGRMQVARVEIIGVPFVFYAHMSTLFIMDMGMLGMGGLAH